MSIVKMSVSKCLTLSVFVFLSFSINSILNILSSEIFHLIYYSFTVWNVSKYRVFSGPYFPAFGLNTERYYFVSLRIQSECGIILDQKKLRIWTFFIQWFILNLHGVLSARIYFILCIKFSTYSMTWFNGVH